MWPLDLINDFPPGKQVNLTINIKYIEYEQSTLSDRSNTCHLLGNRLFRIQCRWDHSFFAGLSRNICPFQNYQRKMRVSLSVKPSLESSLANEGFTYSEALITPVLFPAMPGWFLPLISPGPSQAFQLPAGLPHASIQQRISGP